MSSSIKTVGFIGTGLMGLPMAKNILSKKFKLNVWNRTPGKTLELQKKGAKVFLHPVKDPSHFGICQGTNPMRNNFFECEFVNDGKIVERFFDSTFFSKRKINIFLNSDEFKLNYLYRN